MALDVVIRMSAQEAGAYRAWLEQQRAVSETAQKMNQLGDAAGEAQGKVGQLGGKLGDAGGKLNEVSSYAGGVGLKFRDLGKATGGAKQELTSYFESQVGRWASVAGGIGLATSALKSLVAANRQVREEEAQTTFDLDAMFRNVAVQAGMSEAELPAAQKQIFAVAEAEALPPRVVGQVFQQLISSGAPTRDALYGGVGREFLTGIQAMPGAEEGKFNYQEGAKAAAAYVKGTYGLQGMEGQAGAQNMRREMSELYALYSGKDIQAEELSFMARGAGQARAANIDSTTYKATFARLKDEFTQPEMVSTGLRTIIGRLQTAEKTDSTVEGLAMLNLRPQDVDLTKTNWQTVWDRFGRALKGVDQNTGAAALQKMFGFEAMNQARVLAENSADIETYVNIARDSSKYEQALATRTTGFSAAKQRLGTGLAAQRFGGPGAMQELISQAIELQHPGFTGKARSTAFEWLAPFVGNEAALALASQGGQTAVNESMAPLLTLRRVQAAGAGPHAHVSAPAKQPQTPVDPEARRKAFEEGEKLRDAEREATIKQVRAEAEAQRRQAVASARIDAGNEAGKLLISTLSKESGDDRQIREEASAVEESFRRGRISEFSERDARELHRRAGRSLPAGEAASGRELAERLDRLIALTEQIVAERSAPQEVRVVNPGEAQRRQRRSSAIRPVTP